MFVGDFALIEEPAIVAIQEFYLLALISEHTLLIIGTVVNLSQESILIGVDQRNHLRRRKSMGDIKGLNREAAQCRIMM